MATVPLSTIACITEIHSFSVIYLQWKNKGEKHTFLWFCEYFKLQVVFFFQSIYNFMVHILVFSTCTKFEIGGQNKSGFIDKIVNDALWAEVCSHGPVVETQEMSGQ